MMIDSDCRAGLGFLRGSAGGGGGAILSEAIQ